MVWAWAAIVLLASCTNKKNIPDNILPPAKMQLVLWDVLKADAFTSDFIRKDTAKKPEAALAALQLQIFAVHKTSKEVFYKSYEYYKAHPEIMQPFLDTMIAKYTREKILNTKGKQWQQHDTLKVQ
jgi:hypothetical protein